MSPERHDDACARFRERAPELALGIGDGAERAAALDHLASCERCRAELERLTALAEDLTLLAPAQEPPPGFEARAVAAMRAEAGTPSRWGWERLRVAALAGVAAVVAAAAVWVALGDDRELADSYRETLAVANGEYFEATTLELPGGSRAGYVYGYQGRASWVLAIVYDGIEPGEYRIELVTREGERLPLRALTVDEEGRGSSGAVTPVDYDELAEIRLLDPRGRELADAELDE